MQPSFRRTGIAGCCARAANGHTVAPAIADMNSRRLIASPKAEGIRTT
jgi:hypothetical protein